MKTKTKNIEQPADLILYGKKVLGWPVFDRTGVQLACWQIKGRGGACYSDLDPVITQAVGRFLRAAQVEMARRGLSGVIDRDDIEAIVAYRARGMSAVEAGACRAMHILRTT